VTVTLRDPSAAGSLDQAPVTVYITTDTVSGALAGLLPAIRAARLSPTQALWTL
jgi:ABC-type lipoprotein release transport system permease subunit